MLINSAIALEGLRRLLIFHNLTAYIVPSGDAHYTEFTAKCDERRAFISGFTGSAGTAIVTNDSALLWTDSRYFLQAEDQLDKTLWQLMKDGQSGVLSQTAWLKEKLPPGAVVGVDPTLYTKRQWDSLEQELKSNGKSLKPVEKNLVDEVWDDRPSCESEKPIFSLGLEFSGKPTRDKVASVRQEMKANNAAALIITELDEVAWLLNLRGSDIPYSSTFFSYVIVRENAIDFFVNQTQVADAVKTLKENVPDIVLHNYSDVFNVLESIVAQTPGKFWFNSNANYALVSLIPQDRHMVKLTPIALKKAIKNPTEVAGYRNALIRDSAALCEFFAWLELEMGKGTNITEVGAAEKLHQFRSRRENFFDDSFPTISAAGEHGAIVHYMPTPETDREIKRTDMYLLDSGGLYKDGTTDITRTIHLGTPSQHQKNCYTRVLKGQIALTQAKFPDRTTGQRLDSFARQFLWEAGLDYGHGTGHGVGSFLNVHEGPFGIGGGYNSQDPGMRENFFTSNEPGYYEDNAFGIRLENIIRVRNVSLDHNFQNRGFIGFEDVTFVPYDHKLIDFSLLTDEELKYLNDYQLEIRRLVGSYMRANNMSDDAYNWMMKSTVPVPGAVTPSTTPTIPTTTGTGSKRSVEVIIVPIIALLHLAIQQ